jgi:hypothetical protein
MRVFLAEGQWPDLRPVPQRAPIRRPILAKVLRYAKCLERDVTITWEDLNRKFAITLPDRSRNGGTRCNAVDTLSAPPQAASGARREIGVVAEPLNIPGVIP